MTNWQVQCTGCYVYGHEVPMGPGDVAVRKHPQTGEYTCLECYKKSVKESNNR